MSPIGPNDKPSSAGPVHARLREATHAQHESLESRSNVLARTADPDAKRALVEAFHRLHASLEPHLATWLDDVDGLDFAGRRRGPRLAQDVSAVGGVATLDPQAPTPGSRAEALGWLYVLEGSALGGKVIRKQVTGAGGNMTGLSFLDPYGPQLGKRWRAFLAVLEREGRSDAEVEAMVAGAQSGFRYAEACLCGEPADA